MISYILSYFFPPKKHLPQCCQQALISCPASTISLLHLGVGREKKKKKAYRVKVKWLIFFPQTLFWTFNILLTFLISVVPQIVHEVNKAGIGVCGWVNRVPERSVGQWVADTGRAAEGTPAGTVHVGVVEMAPRSTAAREFPFVSYTSLSEFIAGDVFRYADRWPFFSLSFFF